MRREDVRRKEGFEGRNEGHEEEAKARKRAGRRVVGEGTCRCEREVNIRERQGEACSMFTLYNINDSV